MYLFQTYLQTQMFENVPFFTVSVFFKHYYLYKVDSGAYT